ncbi:MAG: metal ABC transporter ATP-binding protein [Acidimicrobiales bacterium]
MTDHRPEGAPFRAQDQTDVLTVEHLGVSLGGREILRDVSFSVRRGEFTGLIGPNGVGKTTLLRSILGLQATSEGSIRVGRADGPSHHTPIGYVPQKILFDPDIPLRAKDLVGLGLDGHRLGVPLPSKRRRALVTDVLDAVDAGRFADTRVGHLSGGEQQRILIAHALIRRPLLLLLDEPLANLDIRSEQEVVALLARLAAEQGIALLMSAHDMNPLLAVTDRIVYLANGRAASGTTDEVARTEVLTELYGHHVDVIRLHDQVLIAAAPHQQPVALEDDGRDLPDGSR